MAADGTDVLTYLGDGGCHASIQSAIRRVHRRVPFVIDEDDFFQEVTLRALLSRNTFQGATQAQFLAWLTGVAKHCLVDAVRRANRGRETTRDGRALGGEAVVENDEALLRDFAERVLRDVNPFERSLLEARYFAGMSWKQIAAILGQSSDAVRQMHSRLLRRLRERYGGAT